MQFTKQERRILRFLKYSHLIAMLLMSLCVIYIIYFFNEKLLKTDVKKFEESYISKNSELIKTEVDQVYKYIINEKRKKEDALRDSIRSRVYEIENSALAIYNRFKNRKSKDEILEIIKTLVFGSRYNGDRGYFFMLDEKGMMLTQPMRQDLEGENVLEYTDENGYKLVKTMVQTLKEKRERFDQYYWEKIKGSKKAYKKISFYKYFEPLNVLIGTGEYVSDIELDIKKRVLNYTDEIKYGKSGYISILDHLGNGLSKSAKSLNLSATLKESLVLKRAEGGGFFDDKDSGKIYYVKGIDGWNWIVVSSYDKEDLYSEINKKVEDLIEKNHKQMGIIVLITLVIVLFFSFISIYMKTVLKNRFLEYKSSIYEEMEKNKRKDKTIFNQSKMLAISEIIVNIAHQWRQPLSIISTTSSGIRLKKEMEILDEKELLDSLDLITDTTQNLSKTIDSFNNIFEKSSNKELFKVSEVIEEVVLIVSNQYKELGIKLYVDMQDFEYTGYKSELLKVILNILSNSKDKLLDSNNTKVIVLETYREDDKGFIVIKDSGGGVDAEIIDRIFEPYFTTKHQFQGIGLGLYMAKEIINKHFKGDIFIENCEFEYKDSRFYGAEVTIRL